MAISACMQCLKTCGYLCGLLAALNIWFWIGMTIFNAMDNPWLKKDLLLYENFNSDSSRFTAVFAIVVVVSIPFLFQTINRTDAEFFFCSSTLSACFLAVFAPALAATKTRKPLCTTLQRLCTTASLWTSLMARRA